MNDAIRYHDQQINQTLIKKDLDALRFGLASLPNRERTIDDYEMNPLAIERELTKTVIIQKADETITLLGFGTIGQITNIEIKKNQIVLNANEYLLFFNRLILHDLQIGDEIVIEYQYKPFSLKRK